MTMSNNLRCRIYPLSTIHLMSGQNICILLFIDINNLLDSLRCKILHLHVKLYDMYGRLKGYVIVNKRL